MLFFKPKVYLSFAIASSLAQDVYVVGINEQQPNCIRFQTKKCQCSSCALRPVSLYIATALLLLPCKTSYKGRVSHSFVRSRSRMTTATSLNVSIGKNGKLLQVIDHYDDEMDIPEPVTQYSDYNLGLKMGDDEEW